MTMNMSGSIGMVSWHYQLAHLLVLELCKVFLWYTSSLELGKLPLFDRFQAPNLLSLGVLDLCTLLQELLATPCSQLLVGCNLFPDVFVVLVSGLYHSILFLSFGLISGSLHCKNTLELHLLSLSRLGLHPLLLLLLFYTRFHNFFHHSRLIVRLSLLLLAPRPLVVLLGTLGSQCISFRLLVGSLLLHRSQPGSLLSFPLHLGIQGLLPLLLLSILLRDVICDSLLLLHQLSTLVVLPTDLLLVGKSRFLQKLLAEPTPFFFLLPFFLLQTLNLPQHRLPLHV
mmetsp:Transcript_23838/g.37288  ORF Transcript_23838/g.37288 Transcript_23838/m.37288 type:complete len:284 (-) Transcript_23838:488-1339(-)